MKNNKDLRRVRAVIENLVGTIPEGLEARFKREEADWLERNGIMSGGTLVAIKLEGESFSPSIALMKKLVELKSGCVTSFDLQYLTYETESKIAGYTDVGDGFRFNRENGYLYSAGAMHVFDFSKKNRTDKVLTEAIVDLGDAANGKDINGNPVKLAVIRIEPGMDFKIGIGYKKGEYVEPIARVKDANRE